MFRYIGISWTPAASVPAGVAGRMSQRLGAARGWAPALRLPGFHVFTTGHAPGVNGIHPLPGNRGVIIGRLFRRSESSPQPASFAFSAPEADDIIRTGGRALAAQFWGRYIAFIPSSAGVGQVLRDPMGTLPCFRVALDGVHVVFSWLEDWLQFAESPRLDVNWDAIRAQLLLGQLGGCDTAVHGVSQVPPGELCFLGGPSAKPLQVWCAADFARATRDAKVDEAASLLRQTVASCANSWASCYDPILLRLSGGVDSALLLGTLRRTVAPDRITCINYHSAGSDSDERFYARIAARRAGARLLEQERDGAFRLDDVLHVARTPVAGSYIGRMGTGRLDAAAAAACGAKAMFTGSGGDQVFYELRCTWPAADHLKRHGFGRSFLAAALDAAHLGRVSFWEAVRRAIADQSFRGDPLSGAGRYVTLVSADAMTAARQEARRFIPAVLWSATDLPIGKYHHLAELVTPSDYFDPYLRDASPEVVAPLRSQPVVELCLSLPTYLLTQGGRGRGLARQAFAAELPAEIANRQAKGSIDDHISGVLQRHLPLARSLLLDGHLAKQGLLDRKRVEAALSGSPSATHTYASEVHNCIAIEAWLQRISDAPTS